MEAGPTPTSFQQQFFRNTGLGVLNDLNTWLPGRRHRSEQKKIVISTSRWTALSRCGVHVLPVLVSIAIIIINIRQVYIGIDFQSLVTSETINIAFLQTAAKLQELLIVASLTTIVFQLLRDELLYGDGIPLGLIGAGIDFTKLSYFWSPEILGSVTSLFRGRRKYRKIQLGLFLILAGALALLAGPSCAVLLVPQNQDWPAGGTSLFLNGMKDEFWPVELTADSSQASTCSSSSGTRYGICPSGGYHSLWSHYAKLDHSIFTNVVPSYAKELSGNRYYWSIESMQPVSCRTISLGQPQGSRYVVQPHLSVSVLLDQLMQDWWNALLSKKPYKEHAIDNRQAVSSNVLSPLVHVHCSPAEVLPSSNRTVQFPTFESSQPFQMQDIAGSVTSDQPTNHLQFSWVPLPASYESVSTGAVLQSAWGPDNQSRLVVGCSVQARWVPAHLQTEAYTFWQGWFPKNITFDHAYPIKGGLLLDGTRQSTRNAIAVDESWLNTLTPPTPVEGPGYFDWGPSTVESILSSVRLMEEIGSNEGSLVDSWQPQGDTSRPDMLASVVGSVFADGLSRVNIERMYKTQGSPSQWTFADYDKEEDFDNLLLQGKRAVKNPNPSQKDVNEISVEFSITGLSYRRNLVQNLAMVVLFLHIAVATLHTVWTVGRGKSSACWDSVTEILVLAQNSKPAYRSLRNTAAGLQHSYTFAKKISIRPTKLPNAQEADHLEFLLEEEEVHAENEMIDMEQPSLPPSQSAKSSVVHVDESSSGLANISHPSTWPTYRRHSSAPSLWSSEQLDDAQPSDLESPLLAPSNQDLRVPPGLRVKDDHAYG